MITINFNSTDVIVAANSSQIVSDIPVGCIAGHIDSIFSRTTGGLARILLTSVVEFILEAHGQNVHQLKENRKVV